MSRTIPHFVKGKGVDGTSGRFADVFNPATGEVQAKVALASKAEVDAAVAVAAAAFPGWAATPPLHARPRDVPLQEPWSRTNLDKLAAIDHRRARQGAVRRQGRRAPAASRSSSSPAASRIS